VRLTSGVSRPDRTLIGSKPGAGGSAHALADEQVDEQGDKRANVLSGSAGNVVQAYSTGDIHFHQFRMPPPAELPGANRRLVNQKRVLATLDSSLDHIGHDGEPVLNVLLGQRGSGKSTVAVYWANQRSERFPDGQLYANLGAWTDHTVAPSEVLRNFTVSLGVDPGQIPGDLEGRASMYRTLTTGRRLLVLLDGAVSPG
jgi:hypothetical protein